VLVLLAGIYLLAGVTGHDPWKTEDAIHIAIAHGFIGGNWLFPHIAGEPWPFTAPLYHWVAALLGQALGNLLEFHNAARLATTLFGAVYLLALAGAAHVLHGLTAGRLAPLLAIGTLGLLLPLHEAQPEVAGLACAAVAWWGASLILHGHRSGFLLLGLGFGLAFPANGLAGLVIALPALIAPLLRREIKASLLALVIALPLIAAWPLLLLQQSPDLWWSWWRNEFAEATIGRGLPEGRHFEQLLLGAWPVLPLAIWSLWLHRREPAVVALPLLGSLLTLAWYLTGSSRSLGLLATLPALTLLAAAGTDRLRRGAANAFDWFGLMTFSFAAALIWLGASAQALDWPPKIAHNFDKLAPGHEVHYSIAALAFAMLLTVGWLISWWLRRASWRPSLRWAAGTTLLWALTATLWLSWIDHSKTYRPVVASLRAALPQDIDCIDRTGVGISQRAALDYFAGIRTEAPSRKRQCGWRLVIDDKDRAAQAGWTEVWQGGRTSDRKERWYLDRRGR
jgi:4-amino-4-deoxy-L-arabinose transferase-like glycosyltransferase